MVRFQVDNLIPVYRLLRTFKIHDPMFLGELARFDSPSVRKSYFSRKGKSIEELGELLHDARITIERPTERETLDLLDTLFRCSRCKAQCEIAEGSTCRCKCGGRNHGKSVA